VIVIAIHSNICTCHPWTWWKPSTGSRGRLRLNESIYVKYFTLALDIIFKTIPWYFGLLGGAICWFQRIGDFWLVGIL